MNNQILMYLMQGIIYSISQLPLTIVIYFIFIFVKDIKMHSFKFFHQHGIVEFIFILYIMTVLKITGIIGMQFNILWFKNSLRSIGFFTPFSDGSIMMMAFNVALFIPFGFLLPIVFYGVKWNWIKILAIGVLSSTMIELLQMFGGRMSEIDDIIMNTLGLLVGFMFYNIFTYLKKKLIKN